MSEFKAPALLRHTHVQTMISSTFLRRWPLLWRTGGLRAGARDVLLECSEGVRLHGVYNAHPRPERGLAILIHGWEGNADSSYLLSNAAALYAAGFSVFRLHLRDHGPSHSLNRELYHSARLQEILDAVGVIQRRFPHERNFLAGHSLGGNFALRVAARAPAENIRLDRVVAICPALDPANTMRALTRGNPIYHHYFLRRWKRSLRIKLHHYPELGYGNDLLSLQTLEAMNAYFVPRFTEYADVDHYYAAYALTGDALADLQVPSHLILSGDDPIIPLTDLAHVARPPALTLETPEHGGHCGFIRNWRLDGWVDQRLSELLS